MKKNILSGLVMIAVLVVTGLAVLPSVRAGSPSDTGSDGTQATEARTTEENQKRLLQSTPIPELELSLERENLKRRLEFMNDANRPGYVYLLADTGQVIAEYVIKGKPSSLNSLITSPQQIRHTYSGDFVVDSPDLDGSYGANPDGIFFFTADNTYVEWAGRYIYSSERLNIKTPVSLTRPVSQ